MPGKQKQTHGKPKSGAERHSDRDVKKSVVSYTRVEEMPILRLNDPAGLALWLEAGEIYFRRTYQVYGRFFPSGIKPKLVLPPRPTVRAPAAAAAPAAADGDAPGDPDEGGGEEEELEEQRRNYVVAPGILDDYGDNSDDDVGYPDSVDTEQEADMIFADALKSHSKKIAKEQELRSAMYADIRGNLSAESVDKLSEQEKFETYHEENNPYGMLRLILRTHGGAKTGWTVTDSLDSKRGMFLLKQGKDESLLSYKNRFIAGAKTTSEFTDQELAIIFITNMNESNDVFQSDQQKLIAVGKTYEYPATVDIAFRAASKYQSSPKIKKSGTLATTLVTRSESGKKGKHESGKPKGSNPQKSSAAPKSGGSEKTSAKAGSSAAKLKFPCTTCGLLGLPDDFTHFPNQCPHKDEVAKILAAASSETAMMTTVGFDGIDLYNPRASTRIILGDNSVSEKVLRMAAKLQEDEVVLDNASSINLFGNSDLLSGIVQSSIVAVTGVGGDLKVHREGTFCKSFDTYFHEGFDCNILSQARVEDVIKSTDGASITYDPDTGNFEVNIPGSGYWCFARRDDLGGLRVARAYPETAFITVSENRRKYTKRELRGADNARELIRRANFPSDKAMASLVNTGNLLNSPITSSDVHRATTIDGGVIPAEMGKGTKRKPTVLSEEPSTAVVDKDVHLGCDLFFVDGHAFLLTVSNFGYGMAAYLGLEKYKGTRAGTNIWNYLSAMFAAYFAYGFNLVSFSVDKEPGIEAYRSKIEEKGMKYNPKSSESKVTKVERRIRTIKERDRSTRPSLPFKIFGVFLVYSILNNVRCINLFPCTASPHVAPREIFSGIRCDYRRDLNVAFGDYCLVYDTSISPFTQNSPKRRKEECVALLPVGNQDGDVKFLSLATGKILTRNNFKVFPMPDTVIAHIDAMFDKSGAKKYSMAPVYRTPFHEIEDGDLDELIEMEPPEVDVIPLHGREPDIDPPLVQGDNEDDGNVDHQSELDAQEPVSNIDDDVDTHSTPEIVDQNEECADPPVPPEEPDSETVEEDVPPEHGAVTPDLEDLNYSSEATPGADYPGHRYPRRENRTTWKERVFRISVKQALKQYGRKGLVSMVKEIRNVAIDKAAIIPVNPNKLSKGELKSVISSSLFLKEKFKPDGMFEKLKARLVAGGHMQDKELYEKDDISSPTVGTSAVMTVVAIAAKENRLVTSADIGGAYLNARMTKGKLILMRLSKENAAILVWLKPEYGIYLQPNGTMIVRLTKALYGCVESARLWYNHLHRELVADGYVQNPIDICVFNKTVNGVQCTVCVHVDDLLFTSIDESIIEGTLQHLISVYKDVTVHRGAIQQYLGMLLDFSQRGKCFVTMPKFTDEVCRKGNVSGVSATPALETLFVVRADAEPLNSEQAEHFHSVVAMCQYLAKRVRPDILCPVVFLTTRVQAPDKDDLAKLERVLKYLNGTKTFGICIEPDKDGIMSMHVYVDASFAVHAEFKSHTGIVVTFGGGGIYFRSTKQKLNTTSSTEAELVAVSDAMPSIVHVREFLIHQGYNMGPANLYQDNMSTIKLIENGRSNSERTRHINIRFFFVKDRLDAGEIAVKYMPTDDMIADILTKPLQGLKFRELRARLLNWK